MRAEVAEQADALRSGRSGLYAHVGSTPTFGIFRRGGYSASFLFHLLVGLTVEENGCIITDSYRHIQDCIEEIL